ncbi:MAG: sulfotransferase [Chloroflexaceae bacterium]|nr:sulfotransferase [Chloroflexaceae bacterium]
MPKPSFFIVGAAKCGTTALCRYLSCHPEIYLPPLKELHYFDTDLKTSKPANSLADYLAFFAEGEAKLCGEGTPTYLYSEVAAQGIYEFEPAAKIIIMLRDPVSMMYSYHSQLLFNGSSETVPDFKTALDLETERKQGRHIPDRCRDPKVLFYRDKATFSVQIQRYLDIFSREQIHFILFEDFSRNISPIFRETLTFLGVNPDFTTEFNPVNSNKKVRSSFLQTLLKYPPAKVLALGKYLLPLPQSLRRSLLARVKTDSNSSILNLPPVLPWSQPYAISSYRNLSRKLCV